MPAVLMTAVAIVQVVLATTADITAWKGGGFGMFATIDGPSTRRVRVFVEAPGRSEELAIARSQQILEKRARLYPSDSMLFSLAEAVSEREIRAGRPVKTITVELWRAEFNEKMEATDRRLRTVSWDVEKAHDTR